MASVQASPRRKSDKLWRDALMRAVARKSDKEGVAGGLNAIADRVVDAALEGDKDAWKEIGDRIDGKPKQQTELSGPDGEAIPLGIDVRVVPSSG